MEDVGQSRGGYQKGRIAQRNYTHRVTNIYISKSSVLFHDTLAFVLHLEK